jgi:hypothetical protein
MSNLGSIRDCYFAQVSAAARTFTPQDDFYLILFARQSYLLTREVSILLVYLVTEFNSKGYSCR